MVKIAITQARAVEIRPAKVKARELGTAELRFNQKISITEQGLPTVGNLDQNPAFAI